MKTLPELKDNTKTNKHMLKLKQLSFTNNGNKLRYKQYVNCINASKQYIMSNELMTIDNHLL